MGRESASNFVSAQYQQAEESVKKGPSKLMLDSLIQLALPAIGHYSRLVFFFRIPKDIEYESTPRAGCG